MRRDEDLLSGGVVGAGSEELARRFEARGVIHITEYRKYDCVSAADRDFERVLNRFCSGEALVGPDMDDGIAYCDRCGREMQTSLKVGRPVLVTAPDYAKATAFLLEELRAAGLEPREGPTGMLRAEAPAGELRVCFMDRCTDAAPYRRAYERRETTLFVSMARAFEVRAPEWSRSFTVFDLLYEGTDDFRKVVRKIAGLDSRPLPAALRLAPSYKREAPPEIIAKAIMANGTFELTYDGLEQVITDGSRYDLLIYSNGTVRMNDEKGARRPENLTQHEAGILIELMSRRTPVAPSELAYVRRHGLSQADTLLRRARAKVDVMRRRKDWRAFKTVSGEPKRYVFDPPPDFRYVAIVTPL